MGLAPI